jgi:prepilin-type processing-associated H-X9-DG protein
MKRSAFTLTELLVVIGTVGILASLSLTAVSRAKGRALQIKCANNVRQLGMGLQAFVTDHNAYPLFINPEYPKYSEDLRFWIPALQYAELSAPGNSTNRISFSKWAGEGVWKCPAANRPPNLPEDKLYLSYGYNAFGMTVNTDTNSLGLGGLKVWNPSRNPNSAHSPAPPVNESEVVSPSQMMAIGDNFYGSGSIILEGGPAMGRTRGLTDDFGSTKRAYARHQGRANVVFCDGHVESPTLKFLFEDTSDEALSRWNRDHLPHRERL